MSAFFVFPYFAFFRPKGLPERTINVIFVVMERGVSTFVTARVVVLII